MSASASNPAKPFKLTAKEAKEVLKKRRMGLYTIEDTANEAWLVFNDMKPTDVAFTLVRNAGGFAHLNLREMMAQLKMWRDLKCVAADYNLNEIEFGDKKAWLLVVQPPKLGDAWLCPLAMSKGILVSGFSYVFKDKALPELIIRELAGNKCADESDDESEDE